MKISKKILFFIIWTLSSATIIAQDNNTATQQVVINVPEVALIDLESNTGTTIQVNPETPNEAGMAVDFSDATNSSIWINYSSIVNSKFDPARNITAQITSGSVPAGLALSLVASHDAGRGDGTMGTPTSKINLNQSAQNIITGVGSAYTGNGVRKGHKLTYSLELDNQSGSYAKLDADQSNTLTITYTLTDQ